ncbi:HET-domain-containing protein, partial [Setomelanomma holmii]
PSSSASSIECRLHVTSLKNSIPYTALSYVWGLEDASAMRSILLDGKVFHVQRNLFKLLKQMRKEHYTRLLWIDAICVDQAKDDERTHQVSLMGQIYSKAALMLVWLGPRKRR